MRNQNTFWARRCSRGIEYRRFVKRIDARIGGGRVLLCNQVVEVPSAMCIGPLCAADDDCFDARALPARLRDHVQVIGIGEDQTTFRMIEQVRKLRGGGGDVGRHDDGTDLGGTEPQVKKLQTVRKMQADLVAVADTECDQHIRRTIDPLVELRVGEHRDCASEVIENYERLVRACARTVLEQAAKRAVGDYGGHSDLGGLRLRDESILTACAVSVRSIPDRSCARRR